MNDDTHSGFSYSRLSFISFIFLAKSLNHRPMIFPLP
jgi:hypothetical protein